MSNTNHAVDIEVLEKTYSIKCPSDKVDALQISAEFLNQRLSEIHAENSLANAKQLLLLTALNISHELLALQQQNKNTQAQVEHITELQQKVQQALQSENRIHGE